MAVAPSVGWPKIAVLTSISIQVHPAACGSANVALAKGFLHVQGKLVYYWSVGLRFLVALT